MIAHFDQQISKRFLLYFSGFALLFLAARVAGCDAAGLASSPAFGQEGRPWEHGCSYRDTVWGETYWAFSERSRGEADNRAFGKCQAGESMAHQASGNVISLGERCKFQKCVAPTECPPQSEDDSEKTRRALACAIGMLKANAAAKSSDYTAHLRETVSRDLGADAAILLRQLPASREAASLGLLYKNEFVRLANDYSKIARAFANEYRPSFAILQVSLQKYAREATRTPWRDLVSWQSQLVQISNNEAAGAANYDYASRYLAERINTVCANYSAALNAAGGDLLTREFVGTTPQRLCKEAGGKLLDMARYAENRGKTVRVASEKLIQGISANLESKRFAEVDATTQKAKEEAVQLQASAKFIHLINERRKALWEKNTPSNSIDLPAHGMQLQRVEEFLSLRQQCRTLTPVTPWMASGCLTVERETAACENYKLKTVPRDIAAALKKSDQNPTHSRDRLSASIRSAEARGDKTAAVVAYDLLIASFEVSP